MKTKLTITLALCLLLLCAANAQTTWYWTNKANLLKQGRSFGVAVLNEKIYLVGGYCGAHCELATTDEYDPVSDTWTNRADMQVQRYAPAAAVINGRLYALGGVNESGNLATVEEYDPLSNTWTNKASMQQARFAFQAIALGGKIYAIGGTAETPGNDNPLASVEEYDPISDTWTNKAAMPTPRLSFGAAVLNGKIYVVGGRILNTAIPEVWEYTPSSNTWAIKAAMPEPRETLGVVAINGKILAMGGYSNAGGTPHSPVEGYNPVTDTWTVKPNLPSLRNECYAVNLCTVPNAVYVFGGYDDYTMIALSVTPLLNIYTAIELEFFTETNKFYQLQGSSDLINWTNLDSAFPGNNDYWRKLYSTRGQLQLFYRIQTVTP